MSWINILWRLYDKQIVDKFDASNFDVQFKQTEYGDDSIIIVAK